MLMYFYIEFSFTLRQKCYIQNEKYDDNSNNLTITTNKNDDKNDGDDDDTNNDDDGKNQNENESKWRAEIKKINEWTNPEHT